MDLLDCACGFGFMGLRLLALLPEEVLYGIEFQRDSAVRPKKLFGEARLQADWIVMNRSHFLFGNIMINTLSQCAMRHVK